MTDAVALHSPPRLRLPDTPAGPRREPPEASRRSRALHRLAAARRTLADCRLCLHQCGADRRAGPAGRCHAGPDARFFSAQTEVADELEFIPAFAVALSGCTLRCRFCITGDASWNAAAGLPLEADELARRAAAALRRGARTVMILGGEPTLHLPSLLELVARLPDDARLVLKTNACFSPSARPLLAGLFDVWLPDFKFGNDDCAHRLAGVDRYRRTLTDNLLWMARDESRARLVVRHLLMPGHVACCWEPVARWLHHHLPGANVSLRTGYLPAWHAHRLPGLDRVPSRSEIDEATSIARTCGLALVP